ncbi:hypothetical protein HPB48_015818 [Haemaphysalis longicornis]|uniref:Zinc finger PHD-type domain-containing protein n=1 Tax=Haemaphysalis longicornis TaxID=44386 RepID=A0A9J6FA37_HAELO|nr:hypothetical protein HPB48_015818 [Haemaphysalis longicornis]
MGTTDDDASCFVCDKSIPASNDVLVCSECLCYFHLGDCSGVSERTYKSRSDAVRKQWRCPFCRGVKDKIVQAPRIILVTELEQTVKSLKETVNGLEKSVQLMSDKYDSVRAHMNKHEAEIKSLKERVQSVEADSRPKQITEIKHDINELEWQNRKLNLEFNGIPQADKEDLVSKINETAAQLKVPELGHSDITAAHRLPSNSDKIAAIIVRFARRSVRDDWYDARKKLTEAKSLVYIQENLTKQSRTLLWETKQWANENHFRFVWHRKGKTLVR